MKYPSVCHMEIVECSSPYVECPRTYQECLTCFRNVRLEDVSPRYSTAGKERQERTQVDGSNSWKVIGEKERKSEWEKNVCRKQSFWRQINLVFI